ncbi:MAG: S9 family peptidase [Saprospiraceae bacterium]
MKKIIVLSILSVAFAVATFAQKKEVTLEDIWQKRTFSPRYVSGFNFLNDGKHYTKQSYSQMKSVHQIIKYDLTTGEKVETVFDGENLKELDDKLNGRFSNYNYNADESKIIFATASESIYRHSSKANFYIYDIKSKVLEPLSENGKQQLAIFNSTNDKVAFVRENNLFYKNMTNGKETQITTDGKWNHIINGACDWVYEEEFGQDRAFYWSPDGQNIAFMRFDEKAVKEFSMPMYYNGAYPEQYSFKYPKAGETNAVVSVHIYNLKTGKITEVNTGEKGDIYFPRIKWTPDNQLCVFRLNRHQNHLKLLLANPKDGSTKVLLEEKNDYYIDIHDDLTFLKDGKQFVWTSEKSGYNHIYLHDMTGKEVAQITSGEYDVTSFYGVDEKRGRVFYQSAEKSPMQRHVYSVKLDGSKKKKLNKGDGQNSAKFSKTFDYFVNTNSKLNAPYVFDVKNHKGKEVRVIEENKRLKEKIAAFSLAKSEFLTIPTKDVKLNAWMMKPADFDKNKSYPVLMYVYGGPGSQTVKDSWGGNNYLWFQHLTQLGYIVVSVDNRGTGARGQEFKKVTYQQLGKYETIDQIEAAKWLGKQNYIDSKRIGIFGWSYGGYMSSLCLFKGNDVFKAAIAVAPVTNWKWYDSIYTERYMRTPKENSKGYEDNSPVNFADQLKGNYLLVHGIADDNVHFQNTAEMANALIKANKQYDTYFYPNRNHGIYGDNARIHLFTKMTNFLKEKL